MASALLLLLAAGAWWALTRDGGAPADTEVADAGVASMVPEIDSMVPEGVDRLASMAAVTGWRDSFDDNNHGWETSEGSIARSIVDGEYEIDLRVGGQAVSAVAEAGGEFADFRYASSGRLVGGQAESGYGLVFRRVDARNYYVFAVNGMGQWSIWALEDGGWRELRGLTETWTPSDAIVVGGTNSLAIEAVGTRLTASVNGIELVSLEDATFSAGAVGYYAASSRTTAAAHLRVRFDDAEVKVLPAGN